MFWSPGTVLQTRPKKSSPGRRGPPVQAPAGRGVSQLLRSSAWFRGHQVARALPLPLLVPEGSCTHRGLERIYSSGRRLPRRRTHRLRTRWGLSAGFSSLGGFWAHNQTIGGRGSDRGPRSLSKLREGPPPCFPAQAMSECPLGAGPEFGRAASALWLRRVLLPASAPVPGLTPSRPLFERSPAQSGSVSGHSRPRLKIGGHHRLH